MHTHSYLHAHTHTQVVMFQVLDHHTRRNAEEGRVVGALLGSVGSDGTVSLKNGACVLQCVVCFSTLQCGQRWHSVIEKRCVCVAMCAVCCVLQYVAVWCYHDGARLYEPHRGKVYKKSGICLVISP